MGSWNSGCLYSPTITISDLDLNFTQALSLFFNGKYDLTHLKKQKPNKILTFHEYYESTMF